MPECCCHRCCCHRRCRCGDRGLVTLDTGQRIVVDPPAGSAEQDDQTATREDTPHA